ncbi:uncharacterized protein LJ264_016171 [Porphyrio hochstetteri]
MEGVVLLTRVLPGGGDTPGGPQKGPWLWGDPLALGVSQALLGALQVLLGAALLAALGEPVAAQLGAPVAAGALLLVSGATLVALAQGPSVGRARAALALGVLGSVFSALELLVQGLLMPHSCPTCHSMAPAAQGVVLGAQALLMTSAAAGAVLSVTGAVTSARGGVTRAGPPVVLYQAALPGAGAGLGQAPPPSAQ